jgi:3-hydroxyisobutyrate dehydrogenase-like beta-hydroxyacid dehydrogenase
MAGMNIGFVGLGIMGAPMSAHLSRAGHHLFLYDIDRGLARRHADALSGEARAMASLDDLAAASDIVITMLPNGQVVQEVTLGEHGLIHGLRPGALLLDTSSAEPWLSLQTARALNEKGVAMVDAPVSGAQWGAQAAELVFMVGATAIDLERVRPVLELMGHKIHHLGPVGSGHTMKCINNTITAMTAMVDVLNDSTGGSWISQTHIKQRIINRRFDDPFKLELMLKDIGIAVSLGEQSRVTTPMFALGHQLWTSAMKTVDAQASVSEYVRWVEKQTGIEIRGARADEKMS